MTFDETPIPGAWLVGLERRGDERGFFARLFCAEEFAAHGLAMSFAQVNNSLTVERGTLRGMHYQLPPAAEVKLIRCVRGSFLDVVLDLRPESPTFKAWFAAQLSAENRLMMYVPEGCAHGFLTLEPDTETVYLVTAPYSPEHERGVRWNEPHVLSGKDRDQPDFDPGWHLPTEA
jgi:dTDP-4-dehydrorhamnose 3,5-epimerase